MMSFAFQSPNMLLLILLLIPAAWIIHHAQGRRGIVHSALGGSSPSSVRSRWYDRLQLTALTLLLLALARPGISPRRESISRSGRDVIFVLDVSRSMLAEDVYPSRLESAKNGIRDALDSFRSQRVALVIYAGSANILCPLTHDHEFARYMLDQAVPRAVDFGGTTLLSATEKCVDNLLIAERKGLQDLVVLTDGEEHGPQNQRVAELLAEHDVGLLLVGLGDTSSGSRIPIVDLEGTETHLKHDDQFVTTRLNEQGLRELSRLTPSATYVSAGTSAFDLAGLYSDFSIEKPAASTEGAETYVVYREIGFLLIGAAIVLLLVAERLNDIRRLVMADPSRLLIGSIFMTWGVRCAANSLILADIQFRNVMFRVIAGRAAQELPAASATGQAKNCERQPRARHIDKSEIRIVSASGLRGDSCLVPVAYATGNQCAGLRPDPHTIVSWCKTGVTTAPPQYQSLSIPSSRPKLSSAAFTGILKNGISILVCRVIRAELPHYSLRISSVLILALSFLPAAQQARADERSVAKQFADAVQLQQQGNAADALEAYSDIHSQAYSDIHSQAYSDVHSEAYSVIHSEEAVDTLSPRQFATLRFNQGLCQLTLANIETEPRSALVRARAAQTCFLEACQMSAGFLRAAQRLDPTARLIAEYAQRIEEEDKREQELQEKMQELIERLRELQQKQSALRDKVPNVPMRQGRPRRGQPPVPPPVAPVTEVADSKRFSEQQQEIREQGTSILTEMIVLDRVMTPPPSPTSSNSPTAKSSLKPVSILREPVQLMKEAIATQQVAETRLQQWNTWRDAREQQLITINKIQEILDLLASDSMSDSDEGDWDEDDEYDEMMESSDSEEGMMSSMQGQGDFASGANMQALPIPNYSVDDILMQEQGSLQFRQQQRAQGNQSKVEKDW